MEYDRLEEELEQLNRQMEEMRESTQNKAIRRQQLDGEIKVLKEQILAGIQNEEHYKSRLDTIETELAQRQAALSSPGIRRGRIFTQLCLLPGSARETRKNV